MRRACLCMQCGSHRGLSIDRLQMQDDHSSLPATMRKGHTFMTTLHDGIDNDTISSDATLATHPLTRRTLLKGAAAAAGALLAAPAASALAASPAATIAAPYVKRPPEGTITIWDRAGDLYQVFGATIPV